MLSQDQIWKLMHEVEDPEIPVLSVVDLGIIRDVKVAGDFVEVVITPTYSGCPAMKTIEEDIEEILKENNINSYKVTTVLSPPWTTDWMSEEGKLKLHNCGIAPPKGSSADKGSLMGIARNITCPQCGSDDTVMVSQFGSTACKALYKCNMCLEPFDYLKCL